MPRCERGTCARLHGRRRVGTRRGRAAVARDSATLCAHDADRGRDALRDAAARGRVAARPRRGGRRRPVRGQVPRRRPGSAGARRRVAGRRAGPGDRPARPGPRGASRSTRRSATPSRTRRSTTSSGRSGGLNLGMDFLPGALTFNPAAATAREVDRSGLRRRRRLARRAWSRTRTAPRRTRTCSSGTAGRGSSTTAPRCTSITPGATPTSTRGDRSSGSRDHVLLPYAGSIEAADARHAARIDEAAARPRWSSALPDAWLPDDPATGDAAAQRRRLCPLPARAGSRRRARSSRRRIVPEPPRNAFQYAIVRVVPARRARRVPQRRGRPAVPAAPLPRRRGSRSTSVGWRPSRPTSTRRTIRPHLDAIERIAAGDPDGRADRPARPGRAVPLAGRAVEHDHPAVGGPHRAVRRPGGGARAPRGDAGRRPAVG